MALCCLVGPHIGGSQSFKKQRKAAIGSIIGTQLVEQRFHRPVPWILVDVLLNVRAQPYGLATHYVKPVVGI
ncbi:hypothetical protein Abol_247_013 [Acetobacter orleanensis JCM 7639]|nr:hypothetical protein Abol_247_013 [Acetobacter orleanensis JCM 7639]